MDRLPAFGAVLFIRLRSQLPLRFKTTRSAFFAVCKSQGTREMMTRRAPKWISSEDIAESGKSFVAVCEDEEEMCIALLSSLPRSVIISQGYASDLYTQ